MFNALGNNEHVSNETREQLPRTTSQGRGAMLIEESKGRTGGIAYPVDKHAKVSNGAARAS